MFNVNDIVSAFGVQGKVQSVDSDEGVLTVRFDNGMVEDFGLDGKLESWHAGAALSLIRRAPARVTRTVRGFVNMYANGTLGTKIHTTRQAAIDSASRATTPVAATVEVTGTYEG